MLREPRGLSVRASGRAVSARLSTRDGEAAMEPSMFSRRVASLAGITSLVLQLSGASMAAEPRAALPSAPATEHNLSRRIGFEANCGQVDAQVQFVARGAAYTTFLTSTEAVLTLGDRRGGHAVLRMERIG